MDERRIDALIWIGQSYKNILCESEASCAFPYEKGTHCYVHEAERRGCCRKVPFKPKRMIIGESRIFLAHRNDQTDPSRGRIFGCFVLSGIEEVLPARTIPFLTSSDVRQIEGAPGTGDLKLRIFRADLGQELPNAKIEAVSETGDRLVLEGKEKEDKKGYIFKNLPAEKFDLTVAAPGFQTSTARGIRITEKRKLTLDVYLTPRKPRENEKLTGKCWDGSTIVTHIFKKGKWVKTDASCPPLPKPPSCREGRVMRQQCWDGSDIVVARCEAGKWVPTGAKCPGFPEWPQPDQGRDQPPTDENLFEEHRDCSLRLKPKGIYLLDALAKEISTAFHGSSELTKIQEEYLRAKSDTEKRDIIMSGRSAFNNLVDGILEKRSSQTVIPPGLSRMAERRGELILFKPGPVLERKPQAAFRGLLMIDGDRLTELIRRGVSPIRIDALR